MWTAVTTALKLMLVLSWAKFISVMITVKGAAALSVLVRFWHSIICLSSSPFYICIAINAMVALIAALSALHNRCGASLQGCHGFESGLDGNDCQYSKELSVQSMNGMVNPTPLTCYEVSDCHDCRVCSKCFEPLSFYKGYDRNADHPCFSSDGCKRNHYEAEHDTMEATWKAIMKGKKRSHNRTKQEKCLRKSEKWDVCMPQVMQESGELRRQPCKEAMRKSETFKDGVTTGLGVLTRDPSAGLDELNMQVEAFIKKFNEDMRLQRQESEQRLFNMINKGM